MGLEDGAEGIRDMHCEVRMDVVYGASCTRAFCIRLVGKKHVCSGSATLCYVLFDTLA